jgi:lipopolysaccharide export system ATP-binding protein
MKLLDVSGLAKRYGSRQVVSEVSFDVAAGEIVGLLGPNGAGKTTSFRMTCGMVTPDRGRVVLDGQDVTGWPMHRRAREGGLGYLPQQASVFGKLTVEQNLVATMQLLGRSSSQRRQDTARLLSEFGLEHIRATLSSQVSGGERRRVEIARCLVSNPKIVMLDEPFAGIDPLAVQGIQALIRQLAERGLGILITDHAAREILQITERTYVISEGKVLCSGTPTEVVNHPEVRKKYLGSIDSFEPSPRDSRVTVVHETNTNDSSSWSRPHNVTENADHEAAFVPAVSMNSSPEAYFEPRSEADPAVVMKPHGRRFFPQPKTIRQGS